MHPAEPNARLLRAGVVFVRDRRVSAQDVGRGMAIYWRLIVPESGLLRRQWLEGIKERAEGMPHIQ